MGFKKSEEIAEAAMHAGCKKADMRVSEQIPLGFAAGAFIAIGYLLAIRLTAGLPADLEWLSPLLSGAVFPIGLILCLIAGGELLTGNMMSLSMACFKGRASIRKLAGNWFMITVGNFAGAIFIAYVFGHLGGMTEQAPYMDKIIALTQSKLDESFMHAFISGIGCNWLVSSAVWMSYGAKDGAGKILAIWFPTMAFVALGFQHIVANMFLIPAAIFIGAATWSDYFANFLPVYLGNSVGGGLFVAGIYYLAYSKRSSSVHDKK
jgi:formate/nitrite transporter